MLQFNHTIAFLILLISFVSRSQEATIAPDDFLPHSYGEVFTEHHLIVDYFKSVAEINPYVSVFEYGRSNQNRPLIHAIITHPENQARLDEIKKNNRLKTGLTKGRNEPDLDKSIVWLSMGVHGNEGGATESSIGILHKLTMPGSQNWLKEVVVILDPCLNPDGYNRYTSRLAQYSGNMTNLHMDDQSHHEAWPSGRVNHYQHDLNRDWVWATQKETKARLKIYRQWMPHMHADFHELFANNHSYFPPAAEPYHPYIAEHQRELEDQIGHHHASYFDENRWSYFTKERFDLFYPAYGDTYPTINGAIGMTYEQPGHGSSSTSVLLNSGDTLTLQDRIDRHLTLAISSVEFAYENKKALIESFKQYYEEAIAKPEGEYRFYVLRKKGDIRELTKLLDRHEIKYGALSGKQQLTGFRYKRMDNGRFEALDGDLVVPVQQAQSRLVQTLFEPVSTLSDSLTDDLTSWSIPFAFGVEAVATKETVKYESYSENQLEFSLEDAYAWAIEREDISSDKAISALIKEGIRIKTASVPFELDNKKFDRGTFVIVNGENNHPELLQLLRKLSIKHGIYIHTIESGMADNGPDLGSRKFRSVKKQEILIVGGQGMAQYNFGQIWQYFDQEIRYPHTRVSTDRIKNIDLSRYTTIVLPESYRFPDDQLRKILKDWVNAGGNLIAFGYTVKKLAQNESFGIVTKTEKEIKEKDTYHSKDHRFDDYGDKSRKQLSNKLPGASILLEMDNTHPLAYGFGKQYVSLKTSPVLLPIQKNAWNVGLIRNEVVYSGFVGKNIQPKLSGTSSFFVKTQGKGQIVALIDNPLYRSFWQKGKQLFFNAVFLVP